MLHILRFGDRPTPDGVMRAMFAARKSVFVDLLKWDVPVLGDAYEIDQFDDQHARYLILTDDGQRHLGSARLLPTIRPHILDTLYAELCEEEPPRAPEIFEITRFCLDRALGARDRRAVRDTLVLALVDDAIANHVIAYTAIAELGWLQQILAFGWRCRPLGLPRAIGGKTLGALRIDIDTDTPRRLAQAGMIALPPAAARDHRVAA